MKKSALLKLIFILLLPITYIINANSQHNNKAGKVPENCHRHAILQDGPDYSVTGNAYLELQEDSSLVLWLDSTFSTVSGPDLDVYLTMDMMPDISSDLNLGALQSISGYQTYNVPDSVDLGDYWYVAVHCTDFDHYWGGGGLSAMNFNCDADTSGNGSDTTSNGNDTTLSIQGNTFEDNLKVYFPAANMINIVNDGNSFQATLQIYDLAGKELYAKKAHIATGETALIPGLKNQHIVIVRLIGQSNVVSWKLMVPLE